MLGTRILSAIVLIPVVGVALYFGGMAWFILVLAAGLLAGYEYLALMRTQHLTPSYLWGLALIALLVADGQWPVCRLLLVGVGLVPLGALVEQVFRGNAPGSLMNWALAVAGGMYLGGALSFFVRLRALENGFNWVCLALLSTWLCDSAAYFVGSKLGHRPFFPAISPKKTWEGAIGGFLGGMVAVVVLGRLLVGLKIGWGLLLGIAVVLGATWGDLAESVIKRQVGVKDSSHLIPGHGGMLDRVDSLLFVVPIVYWAAVLVGSL